MSGSPRVNPQLALWLETLVSRLGSEVDAASVGELFYWEAKVNKNPQIGVWHDKAVVDAPPGKLPVVVHKTRERDWFCTMALPDLLKMLGARNFGRQVFEDGSVPALVRALEPFWSALCFRINTNRHIFLRKHLREATALAGPGQYPVVLHRRVYVDECWLATVSVESFLEAAMAFRVEQGG